MDLTVIYILKITGKPIIIRVINISIRICRCNGNIRLKLSRLKQGGHDNIHVRKEILAKALAKSGPCLQQRYILCFVLFNCLLDKRLIKKIVC